MANPNPDQSNLILFKKGQSGNPKGRQKKKYSQHIKDIKDMGYESPTKSEYFEMIGLLLSMEEQDLLDFAKDKTKPYWIRLIVTDLNAKASRQRMMSDYRDWLFGKAEQKTSNTVEFKKSKLEKEMEQMTDEELMQFIKETASKISG